MPNKSDREAAIKAIVYKWIENEDPTCMGQLIFEGSFSDLNDDVKTLFSLGRSTGWKSGVQQWIDTIAQMYSIFFAENFGEDTYESDAFWKATDSAFAPGRSSTRTEFVRLLKHAIHQGSTYAYLSI